MDNDHLKWVRTCFVHTIMLFIIRPQRVISLPLVLSFFFALAPGVFPPSPLPPISPLLSCWFLIIFPPLLHSGFPMSLSLLGFCWKLISLQSAWYAISSCVVQLFPKSAFLRRTVFFMSSNLRPTGRPPVLGRGGGGGLGFCIRTSLPDLSTCFLSGISIVFGL